MAASKKSDTHKNNDHCTKIHSLKFHCVKELWGQQKTPNFVILHLKPHLIKVREL
jgi:hypothetical protein